MNQRTTPRNLLRRLRRDDGQSAFELMLILPFFVLFFLLIVDLGILTYEYVSVSNAVREGARFGAVNCGDGSCTQSEVVTRALDRSGGLLTPAEAGEVSVGWFDVDGVGTNSDRGDAVVVSINHPYSFLFFPVTIPVVSCADMRLEQRDSTSPLPAGSGC